MQGIKITTIGLDDTTESFTKMDKNMTGRKMMPAVISGSLLILNRAKELIHKVTGTAMRSLHVGGFTEFTPDFNPSEGYSDIGGDVETDDEAKVEVGTNIVYGPRLEFGFVGTDSLGRNYHQPAYPYLRPAFDEKQDACIQEVSDALDVLIEEALK
jgi:hypothetical protein